MQTTNFNCQFNFDIFEIYLINGWVKKTC